MVLFPDFTVSLFSAFRLSVETVKSGNNTIAGYYQLPPAVPDGENRFILFRKTSPHDATLIYLEGQTQLDKLINLFINKKQ